MNKITEEQIENTVDNAINKVTDGIWDVFDNIYNGFEKVIEENPKLKGGKMPCTIMATSVHICTRILKETLKDLLCE